MLNKTNQKSLDINTKEDIKQTEINAMEKVAISNSYHTGVIETNLFLLKALLTINGAAILSILTFIGNTKLNYDLNLIKESICYYSFGVGIAVVAGGVLSYMYNTLRSKSLCDKEHPKAKIKSKIAFYADKLFIILIISSFICFSYGSTKSISATINQKENNTAKIKITKYEEITNGYLRKTSINYQ